jgi:lysophospholipase L1-like esterase
MRKFAPILFAILLSISLSQAQTPPPAAPATRPPAGLVTDPCPPAQQAPQAPAGAADRLLVPGKIDAATMFQAPDRPDLQAFLKAQQERAANDWPYLCRYASADAALRTPPRVVLLGDSITELWVRGDPSVFSDEVIGRGISGQTTPQMLLRFFQDVIDLHPQVVHIMAGTNDVAGNTGPTSEQDVENNITAMVELAHVHHIRVVLASIPPAAAFPWNPSLKPASTIVELNQWLRSYASKSGSRYVDYYSVLADSKGGFRPELSNDGVHPNRDGFAAMRPLLLSAIGNKDAGNPDTKP